MNAFEDFLEIDNQKILSLGQTRWLSVHSYFKWILEQWDALTLYFTLFSTWWLEKPLYENNDDVHGLYFGHDSWIQCISNHSLPLFHTFKLETKRLVATLSKNFLEVGYVNALKNSLDVNYDNYYVAIQKIYLGLNAQIAISELVDRDPMVDHNHKMKLYLTAREFYKEAVGQIKTRFIYDEDLREMSCLVEPSNAAKLNLSSLAPIPVKHFPPKCPRAAIHSKWHEQSSVDVLKDLYQSPVEYWRFVLSIVTPSGWPGFVNLRQVIYIFLSLPFSNVVAERLFSTLKEVKADKQNKLSTLTLSAIVLNAGRREWICILRCW